MQQELKEKTNMAIDNSATCSLAITINTWKSNVFITPIQCEALQEVDSFSAASWIKLKQTSEPAYEKPQIDPYNPLAGQYHKHLRRRTDERPVEENILRDVCDRQATRFESLHPILIKAIFHIAPQGCEEEKPSSH
ncbi:hypothetical protein DPMN_010686 [Dreissena polymorpha]|uniref:Uncharacterized protein n=1 Tax=Dreissena polymorpha TaxID=45954 RepID=A0A9D4N3M4_DREPO|nr:hypothetical protein DPMN_010686 [Dreissena polymorpha]